MKSKIILISAALWLAACGGKNTPETTTESSPNPHSSSLVLTAEQLQNAHLEIARPERRSLGNLLKVNGFIEAPPRNLVSVSFPLGGYLKQTKLLPGMHVRRGEVLATLEDPQYITLQQDYLTATARLEFLAADLARQDALSRDQSASEKALQQARAEHQMQLIQAKALAEKLRLIGLDPARLTAENISKSVDIRAPIDGFVSAVKVNIGKYVSPTDVLFELVNPDDIHLTIKVFERDLPALKVGQKVSAYAQSDPSRRFAAHVILVSQNVGDDRSVEVHCHFDRDDRSLLPGMFMTAEIEAASRQTVAVPEAAVVRFENKHYVFVAKSASAFEMTEVETGATEGGFVEIASANAEALLAQNVVVKNAYTLLMAMKNAGEEE